MVITALGTILRTEVGGVNRTSAHLAASRS